MLRWKQRAETAEENCRRLEDEVAALKTKLVRIAEAVKEERLQFQEVLSFFVLYWFCVQSGLFTLNNKSFLFHFNLFFI